MSGSVEAVLGDPTGSADMDRIASTALATARIWAGTTPTDPPDDDGQPAVAVIMCLWRRQHRLPAILNMLSRQTGVRCDLYLWNNDPEQADRAIAVLDSAVVKPWRVTLAVSQANIGGFGRFYWARKIADRYSSVVFLDDDELVSDDALATFLDESAPATIASAWAFTFPNRRNYWRREPVRAGGHATYCGTGGMVCDVSIFRDDRLFRCPDKYWFCEDIWLSYFAAAAHGWQLAKSGAEVALLSDELALNTSLVKTKMAFYRWLNRRGGWPHPSAAVRQS